MKVGTLLGLAKEVLVIFEPKGRRNLINRDTQVFILSRQAIFKLVKANLPEIKKNIKVPRGKLDSLSNIRSFVDTILMQIEKELDFVISKQPLRKTIVSKTRLSNNTVAYRFDSTTGSDTFKILNNIVRELKKRLIFNSLKKPTKNNRTASLIFAGIDTKLVVEPIITEKDTVSKESYNRLYKQASNTIVGNAPVISKGKKAKGAGTELGHTRGAAIVDIDTVLNNYSNLLDPDAKLEIQRVRTEVLKIDAEVSMNARLWSKLSNSDLSGFVNVSIIIPELAAGNSVSGSKLAKLIKEFKTTVSQQLKQKMSSKALLQYTGSKSLQQELIDGIILTFKKGKRPKTKTRKKKYRASKRIVNRIPEYRLILAGKKKQAVKAANKVEDADTQFLSSFQLMRTINPKMHDYIKSNMGKGLAKKSLNYRTGRFARSAKVAALISTKSQKALSVKVKYMKSPYSTFEKGGKLHTPLRDPKAIFRKSIRQILRDEYLINISRINVETTHA